MWTHLEGFENLSATELDALVQAPVLITILVAGADGEIDREERFWTDRLMQTRAYSRPKVLNEFYRVVATGFLDKVDQELAALPQDAPLRSVHVANQLKTLNPILAKLDVLLGADLYKSFIGLAREAAVSSGGFLRFGAVSSEEAEWVSLPMITPIYKPPSAEPGIDPDDEWRTGKKDEWEE